MTRLTVPDMTCGHCKAAVEKAIHGIDAGAEVKVDLDSKIVEIPDSLPLDAVQKALKAEGYDSQVAG